MKVTLNHETKVLEIDDTMKRDYWLIVGLLFLAALNGIISIIDETLATLDVLDYVVIGVTSSAILMLIYYMLTRTIKPTIPLSDIKKIRPKRMFTWRYMIHLKGGKIREIHCNTFSEFEELKRLFQQLGFVNA